MSRITVTEWHVDGEYIIGVTPEGVFRFVRPYPVAIEFPGQMVSSSDELEIKLEYQVSV